MRNDSYILSFTAAGVLRPECVRLAEAYLELGDWSQVRQFSSNNNLLQAAKASSGTRVCRELVFRLQHLMTEELRLLCAGVGMEQEHILWLAICRRYRLVAEFAIEVVRERFVTFGPALTAVDFDAFYNRKADWEPELDALSVSTRKKLRQVVFRMLRESGIMNASGVVLPTILSSRVHQLIEQNQPSDLLYFPIHYADLASTA